VPLVVAGEGQDKAVTNAIVQWSGVGLNIGDRSPGLEKIREGIKLVLENSSYKTKADAMSRNIARYDVGAVVDGVIQGVVHEWASKRF
jgi:UDP:flavonoid glycosyltransferase YjiC (YdhE family)